MSEERSSNENTDSYLSLEVELLFPDNYEAQSYLGEGSFGQVIRCFKKDTKETVAVKVPGPNDDVTDELNILRYLQRNHLDKCNIVRFIEAFKTTDNRVALVFENLDVTLHDYIFHQGDFKGLYLHDVRSVIQQMATALNALKSKGVIHSDIKADNIMLVDGAAQPIRVKLIDFGLAIPTVKARVGAVYQVAEYRAPEIYLGLPFTEGIDMWSLGTIMALMVLGTDLITGNTRYDRMRRLVELFGVPPDHILNKGLYSNNYFIRAPSGQWRFKTPREYWGFHRAKAEEVRFQFQGLDQLETSSLVNLNMVEAEERRECIDLMKAMLCIDPNERITPFEVLNHPFIIRGTVQHSSDNEQPGTSKTKEPGTNKTEEPGTSKLEEPGHDETEEPRTNEPEEPAEPGTNEPEEPAEPGTNEAEEPEEPQEPGTNEPEEPAEPGTNEAEEPEEPQEPGTNEPEEPRADETTEWQTSQTDEPEECNNDVCSTYGTYGPVLPGVMLASSPEFDSSLKLEESVGQQFYTCGSSGFHESIPPSSSPRVIFVQSAPPDCCFDLDEDDEPQSEYYLNGSSGFRESIPASSSPRVIFVQSAPPDCCFDLDEDDEPQSEYCSAAKLADPSKDSPAEYPREDKSGCPYSLFLAKTCDSALTATDHTDPEKKKKKKKKKNYFKRFFSWMKKTFCSCVAGDQDQD